MEVSNTLILLTLIVICGILIAVNKHYKLMMISGFSMLPSLKNRELVIVKKDVTNVTVGSTYAFYNPDNLPCVKRLSKVLVSPSNGKISLFFLGDNEADSIDSRSYGFIDYSKLIGEVNKIKWRN